MSLRPSKHAGEISEHGHGSITKTALPASHLHDAVSPSQSHHLF